MIHLLFEQSGTFRDEFRALGYEAQDYDIQNEYGRTDIICDLFDAIRKSYEGGASVLDKIGGGRIGICFLSLHTVRNTKNDDFQRFSLFYAQVVRPGKN